ncbi:MAG: thiosulfate oxidation carrier protein SoxY [Pseudomonadota bacterium]
MDLTRRQTVMLGLGAAVMASIPASGFANADDLVATIKAFTGGAEVRDSGVEIIVPDIAENGNNVPVEVIAANATDILLLGSGNPNPRVATFHFGALAAASRTKTRIRLAQSQDIIAIAKFADGSYVQTKRTVRVTIGGCGA